jgi:hypothetical protein
MNKDREIIYKTISKMLDNPDTSGVYPTSTAITDLELYVITQRIEAIGWCYAYCCSLLDRGNDPRTEEVHLILDAMPQDLGE